MKYVALLRGVNVGGRNKLPMKDLAAMFSAAGCSDVVTFIQSGNVVFTAPKKLLKTLSAQIAAKIAESFGHKVPVILRSACEVEQTLRNNPFPNAQDKMLAVAFLADSPAAEAVARLDPNRSPGDQFHVIGREVYMHLLNGFADTKLTNAWLDSKLSTVSTARNWTTVNKLCEQLRA